MKCFGNSSTTSLDVASVSTNNQQLNLPYSSSFLIQHVNSRHLRSRGTCATAGGSWTWRAWGTWAWRAEGSGRCPCLNEGNRLHCVHDSWIMDQAIKIHAHGQISNGAKKKSSLTPFSWLYIKRPHGEDGTAGHWLKFFGNGRNDITTSLDVASVSTNNQQLNLPYSSSFLIQHVNSRHLRSRGTCASAGGSWTWRAWGTWAWRARGAWSGGRCRCLKEWNTYLRRLLYSLCWGAHCCF